MGSNIERVSLLDCPSLSSGSFRLPAWGPSAAFPGHYRTNDPALREAKPSTWGLDPTSSCFLNPFAPTPFSFSQALAILSFILDNSLENTNMPHCHLSLKLPYLDSSFTAVPATAPFLHSIQLTSCQLWFQNAHHSAFPSCPSGLSSTGSCPIGMEFEHLWVDVVSH